MKIEIIPLGEIDKSVLEYLKENLADIFNAEVFIEELHKIPEHAFNRDRQQYYSTAILSNLAKIKKEGQKKIIAVIDEDIYAPGMNYLFGEADFRKKICIISLKRLHDIINKDSILFLNRSLKEAVHEIGHLLGLEHCLNTKCVMHFSNTINEVDVKDYHFCEKCKKLKDRGVLSPDSSS